MDWLWIIALLWTIGGISGCSGSRPVEGAFVRAPNPVLRWLQESRATDGVRVQEVGELSRDGVLLLRTVAKWRAGAQGKAGHHISERRFQANAKDAAALLRLLGTQRACVIDRPKAPMEGPIVVIDARGDLASREEPPLCLRADELLQAIEDLRSRAAACIEEVPPLPSCEFRTVGLL
jgi:hypothetical protein